MMAAFDSSPTCCYSVTTTWSGSTWPSYNSAVTVVDAAPEDPAGRLWGRERESFDRLRKRWGDLAWVRLWWLQKREALAMRRCVQRRPALRHRSCRRPWPVAVTAWRLQVERLRKGSRETRTEPRRRRER